MLTRRLILAAVLFAAGGSPAWGTITVIPDVPSYIWYNGCGPTAIGMVIGYWDAKGFPNLISGSNDWDTNQQAIKDAIASPEHIRDYVPTPDAGTTHADNCIADFSYTSRKPDVAGWGYFNYQDNGFVGYAQYRGCYGSSATQTMYSSLWSDYTSAIDANKPVELLVDSDGDGATDHFVAAIAYDNTPEANRYGFYDTWTRTIHWENYHPVTTGSAWGIYGGTFFTPRQYHQADANNDGLVDVGDLGILATHYGRGNMSWADGDFTGDGIVDVGDLAVLASNYGNSYSNPAYGGAPGGDPIPEPGTVALLALGGALLLLRRRRSFLLRA